MSEAQVETKPTKAKPESLTVKMTDGREVEFVGKKKLLKETIVDASRITVDADSIIIEPGAVSIRMDFRNGETRLFGVPIANVVKAIGHGMEQKYGDETAGTEDPDDMVLEVDALDERLQKGEWRTVREPGSSMSGTSTLLKALVEVYTTKSLDELKAYLKARSPAEKAALRNSAKLKDVVARIDAEKAAKNSKVDTEALLGELA